MPTDSPSASRPLDKPVTAEIEQPKNISHKSSRNATLEGLRGLAAFLVVVTHVFGMIAQRHLSPFPGFFAVQEKLAMVGSSGVLLFFMISGYLIIQSLTRHSDLRRFFVNRVRRIYPVFLPLHLLLFVAGPIIGYEWMANLRGKPVDWSVHFLSNLFFLPGTLNLPIAQRNAWSLSYEAFFYLIAALFFLVLRLPDRLAIWKNVLIFAAVLASTAYIYWHPLAVFFVAGVAVFLFGKRATERLPWNRFWQETGFVWLALMVALSPHPIIAVFFGALLFFTLTNEWGLLSGMLRRAEWQFLGMISYSLYLIHPFVLAVLREILTRFEPVVGIRLGFSLFAMLGILLSVAVSYGSYRLLEVRLLR